MVVTDTMYFMHNKIEQSHKISQTRKWTDTEGKKSDDGKTAKAIWANYKNIYAMCWENITKQSANQNRPRE